MKKIFLLTIFIIGAIAVSYSTCYALTGKQLFSKEGCTACHAVNGKGGLFGPNLSSIGKIRTYSWIKRQIINPKLNFFTPNSFAIYNGKTYESIMPPANKKIDTINLNRLTQYLASLK